MIFLPALTHVIWALRNKVSEQIKLCRHIAYLEFILWQLYRPTVQSTTFQNVADGNTLRPLWSLQTKKVYLTSNHWVLSLKQQLQELPNLIFPIVSLNQSISYLQNIRADSVLDAPDTGILIKKSLNSLWTTKKKKKVSRNRSGNCKNGLLSRAIWMFSNASMSQRDNFTTVLLAGPAFNSVKQVTISAYLGINWL